MNEGAGDPSVLRRLVQCRPFPIGSDESLIFCDLENGLLAQPLSIAKVNDVTKWIELAC